MLLIMSKDWMNFLNVFHMSGPSWDHKSWRPRWMVRSTMADTDLVVTQMQSPAGHAGGFAPSSGAAGEGINAFCWSLFPVTGHSAAASSLPAGMWVRGRRVLTFSLFRWEQSQAFTPIEQSSCSNCQQQSRDQMCSAHPLWTELLPSDCCQELVTLSENWSQ